MAFIPQRKHFFAAAQENEDFLTPKLPEYIGLEISGLEATKFYHKVDYIYIGIWLLQNKMFQRIYILTHWTQGL